MVGRATNKTSNQLDWFIGIVVSIPALLVAGFLGFMHDWTIGWFLLLVLSLPGILRLSELGTRWYRHRSRRRNKTSQEHAFWRYPVIMAALTLTLFFGVYVALDFIIGP